MKKKFVMNGAVKAVLAGVLGLALVSSMISCASTGSETKGTGFLGQYYKNLQPGPKDGAKERWLKPGVDFGKYNKVILEHVIFFFDDMSEFKAIDTAELDEHGRVHFDHLHPTPILATEKVRSESRGPYSHFDPHSDPWVALGRISGHLDQPFLDFPFHVSGTALGKYDPLDQLAD
jgi:hypothetical protein